MALRAEIQSLLQCGASDILGTGGNHCPFDLNDMSGSGAVGLIQKGKTLPDDITLATMRQMIQKGELIWLPGIFAVEDQSSENQVETSSSQIERLASAGKPKMLFQYTKGRYFNAALSSLQSYGNYDVIFSDGYNLLYRKTGGGFTGGQIQHLNYQITAGAAAAKSSFSIQLLDKRQYDQDFAYISGDNLDFSLADLDGANDVVISYVNVPQAGDTTLEILVKGAPDNHVIEELDASNFSVTIVGASVTPTAGANTGADGAYTLTLASPLTTGQTVSTRTFDGTQNANAVITSEGVIYKAKAATTVVIA